MKKHLCSISYDLPGWIPDGPYGYKWLGPGRTYEFTGYVYGNTISAERLFRTAFGFGLPNGTTITIG